jgi:hypothetical protein
MVEGHQVRAKLNIIQHGAAAAVIAVAALLALSFSTLTTSTPTAEASTTADVKITSLTVGTPNGSNQCVNPLPAELPVNTNLVICTRVTVHNNGPVSPVDLTINRSASFIPVPGFQTSNECSITPSGGILTFVGTPVSVTLTRNENYTVNCSKPSSRE